MIGRLLLSLRSRLRDDQRGMATIEFALLSVLFFFVMTAGLDIGMWYQQRLRLDSAVEQGSMIAFNSRAAVDQAAIGTYVAAAAKLSAPPTVTVGCNGGSSNCVNSGRTCACLSGTTPNPTFTATACNATCGDGSLAGYYMNIRAVATSSTMLVPAAMLGGNMVQTRSAVVRLQ
jgi:Flp pilus assembly protein TadG